MAPTIADVLMEGERILREAGIEEHRRDAGTLLRNILSIDHARLIAGSLDEVSGEQRQSYLEAVYRRSRREPLQYIVANQEFYGLSFEVTPDVLIPRPETEFLVEKVISLAANQQSPLIVDVGTGSGCIAIAVAVNLPRCRVIATDLSAAAIAIAKSNAELHNVISRIEFVAGDLLDPLRELSAGPSVDVIASNPPYVPEPDLAGLQQEVCEHEPRVALAGGADGLDCYRRLFVDSHRFLKTSAALVLEIGYGQLYDISNLAASSGWTTPDVTCDLQGIPRTVVLRPA